MFIDLSSPREFAEPTANIRSAVAAESLSDLERMAIGIGINDGVIARRRTGLRNFLIFFANSRPMSLANPRLEALRKYAELARAVFPRNVAVESLEDAGFSPSQIRELLQIIVNGSRPRSA